MVRSIELKFIPPPTSVIFTATFVVLFFVYELLDGNSPDTNGGATAL